VKLALWLMFRIEFNGFLKRLLFTLRKWALIVLDELRCGLASQRLDWFREHDSTPLLMIIRYADMI